MIAAISVFPVVGWLISALLAIAVTIPLHFLWGWLAPTYFYFLPPVYLNMGFIDMAGLVVLMGFLKMVFLPSAKSATVKNVSK